MVRLRCCYGDHRHATTRSMQGPAPPPSVASARLHSSPTPFCHAPTTLLSNCLHASDVHVAASGPTRQQQQCLSHQLPPSSSSSSPDTHGALPHICSLRRRCVTTIDSLYPTRQQSQQGCNHRMLTRRRQTRQPNHSHSPTNTRPARNTLTAAHSPARWIEDERSQRANTRRALLHKPNGTPKSGRTAANGSGRTIDATLDTTQQSTTDGRKTIAVATRSCPTSTTHSSHDAHSAHSLYPLFTRPLVSPALWRLRSCW